MRCIPCSVEHYKILKEIKEHFVKRLHGQFNVTYLCNLLQRLDYTAFVDSKWFFFNFTSFLPLSMYSLKSPFGTRIKFVCKYVCMYVAM